jgi:hypothetical protein
MSNEIEVYKAIAAIQGELAREGISKSRKNQQQGFAYRGIDDVYAALAPLVAKHNLCILPRVVSREASERTSAKGGVLFYTAVTVDFDLVSAVDGSKHTVTAVGEAFDSGDKSIGKAQSYAYKAMAFMLFAIPVEGQDNDPDATSHEVKEQRITEQQYFDLLALIADVGADQGKFCVYYKINDPAELPASKFASAVKGLEQKRGK